LEPSDFLGISGVFWEVADHFVDRIPAVYPGTLCVIVFCGTQHWVVAVIQGKNKQPVLCTPGLRVPRDKPEYIWVERQQVHTTVMSTAEWPW